MHIKDIETRTGLSRANIRYYEQEGLVHPDRARNGYRDYSQEDLDTLLRVRLLRRLEGLSVVLVDEGLSDEGRTQAEQAARRDPNITLKKRGETHGGTRYH